jgi:CHAT domain-containing protein
MNLRNEGSQIQEIYQSIPQILDRAIQQSRSLGDMRSEAYALGTLGEFYEQTQQLTEAQQLTERALILSQEIDASDIAYRWQWQLGRLLKAQGKDKDAIAAYETAVSTLESLRNDLVAVNRDLQFNFRDNVEPVYRQTVELLLRSTSASPSPQTLDKARRLIEALQLAELDNFFREACLNDRPVALDEVVDRDNPTAAIFYPIILENELGVIVKIPNRPLRQHRVKLLRPQIEATLTRLQEIITEPDREKETLKLSQQIYNWLIEPIANELQQNNVDTLIFVPDGLFRNIPLASLHDGKKYLIENYAIALSPGLQLFAAKAFGEKRIEALTAGLTQPPQNYQQYAALPEVKLELNAIEKAGISTTQLLDRTFTKEALGQQIQQFPFKIIHLATHGQFSSIAKDNFILTADGPINIIQLNNLLRDREQNIAEPIELLVLSACQTATGDDRATLGLAGVALKAGARSTLASLWQIDDRSTAILIGEFYRQLANAKVTKAEALRRAQLLLLEKYPNYNHPSYWSAYVLVGNWL